MTTLKLTALTYDLAGRLDWRSQRVVNSRAMYNDMVSYHFARMIKHAKGFARAVIGSAKDSFYNLIGF